MLLIGCLGRWSSAGPPAEDDVVVEIEDSSISDVEDVAIDAEVEVDADADVEVEVEAEGAPEPPSTTQPVANEASTSEEVSAREAELDARILALEQRLADQEQTLRAPATSPMPQPQPRRRVVHFGLERPELPPTSVGFGPGLGVSEWGVRLSGYVQAQYQWNQLSEDQLGQGGVVLNRNRFMVRRGRIRVSGDWRWAAFDFELDGSTTRGPFVGVRQANASFVWRNPDTSRPPFLMLTFGLTEIPFGHELRTGQRELPFMERSAGSLAFFPGPIDVGVRARGGVGPFRYDLAVMGGTPLDDRADGAGAIDPTAKPDGAGRLGFEVGSRRVALGGGVSGLLGTGFHAGQDAEKSRLEWVDFNENGVLNSGETVAVPGRAATPSLSFRRWAAGADIELAISSKAGWTQLALEFTLASNLDRDFLVADPIAYGADLREIQAYASIVQELFGWALIGARYDYYDPNTDLLDRRRGVFVPAQAGLHTLSPLVGALLSSKTEPSFRARVLVQYDMIWDRLGRDERGVPANLRNDQLTVRVQGEF